jgi:siroheme synthase (precorrin-2 oxidase/ferrochelatase)
MRTNLIHSPTDRIILIGTGETATDTLWRLCASGARIRWYADSADVGAETVLAHALAGGRIEVTFEDPGTAPLGEAAAIVAANGDGRDLRLVEHARASGTPIHVAGRPDLSSLTLDDLDRAAPRPRSARLKIA